MIASAMQLVQLICYGKRQGYNDKALTWRKNLLTVQLVLLDLMKFLYLIFFSRVFRSLSHAPSQVLTLVCSFSNAYSREIREIPITNILSSESS